MGLKSPLCNPALLVSSFFRGSAQCSRLAGRGSFVRCAAINLRRSRSSRILSFASKGSISTWHAGPLISESVGAARSSRWTGGHAGGLHLKHRKTQCINQLGIGSVKEEKASVNSAVHVARPRRRLPKHAPLLQVRLNLIVVSLDEDSYLAAAWTNTNSLLLSPHSCYVQLIGGVGVWWGSTVTPTRLGLPDQPCIRSQATSLCHLYGRLRHTCALWPPASINLGAFGAVTWKLPVGNSPAVAFSSWKHHSGGCVGSVLA